MTKTARIHRRWLAEPISIMLLVTASLLFVVVPATADPKETVRDSINKVRDLLAPYGTQSDMNAFVGAPPTRRYEVPGRNEISAWPLSKREPGWRPLAKALRTGDRLNLICEFPKNDSPRHEDSCSVHRQRSNRSYYRSRLNPRGKNVKHKQGVRANRQLRAELRADAQQLLDNAHTAFELSTLVGAGPEVCRNTATALVCIWKSNSGTYGHGTLAMSIEARFSKKVELNCTLPIDGTPRAPDSCKRYISG